MPAPSSVADACRIAEVVLPATATKADVPEDVRGEVVLLGALDRRELYGAVRVERLGALADGDPLAAAADHAILVPAELPLERAFRLVLRHHTVRWVVTEAGGVLARRDLVPAVLEGLAGMADERTGLAGDPVGAGSPMRYRCPAEPEAHVFAASRIEAWTTDLRAHCPVDGELMTTFLPGEPPADEGEG